jgi:hypothetical protein
MIHKWILEEVDGEEVPCKLSDDIADNIEHLFGGIEYNWVKEEHSDATVDYVGYCDGKEIGRIPLDWLEEENAEKSKAWAGKKGWSLDQFVNEIMNKHQGVSDCLT